MATSVGLMDASATIANTRSPEMLLLEHDAVAFTSCSEGLWKTPLSK